MNFLKRQRQPGGLLAYKGRIGRLRFFAWNLLLNILAILLLALMLSKSGTPVVVVLLPFFVLILVLQSLNCAKRLHDINMPGWIGFIIIFGLNAADVALFGEHGTASTVKITSIVITLSLLVVPGTKGPNKYGLGYNAAAQAAAEEL